MGTVMTIRGEIAGEDLGVVDYHEHLYFEASSWLLREDPDFRLNNVEKSARELRSWTQAGGKRLLKCRPSTSVEIYKVPGESRIWYLKPT